MEISLGNSQYGNSANLLSRSIFGKNFVKVTVLLKKLLNSSFDEFFFSFWCERISCFSTLPTIDKDYPFSTIELKGCVIEKYKTSDYLCFLNKRQLTTSFSAKFRQIQFGTLIEGKISTILYP